MLKLYRFFLLAIFTTLLCANSDLKFDLIKKGTDDNNTLLIIGGIQGDEPGGFIAASLLTTHYEITKGSVWVVPNLNFYSIIKRSRGPYGDMNRKFAALPESDPEYKTIQRIKSHIKDESVKLVVNLHDGSGYYRPKYIDKLHSPYRWGQCSIIDQTTIDVQKYSDLKNISEQVVEYVNKNLLKDEDKYHVHNTRTKEGDKEMEKTLTYFAIKNGKAAFGNEASKSLPTHKRAYYHLLALEKYMDVMGIEYKRKFKMTANDVYRAINNDIQISFYDERITLPLNQVRKYLKYFPLKEEDIVDFKASNPLMAIVKNGNIYTIHYGNRRLSNLKADYQIYNETSAKVSFLVDGQETDVEFGSILEVSKDFLVKHNDDFRVNIIGYTNKKKIETDVSIRKKQIAKKYSIDKKGSIYRVEYYAKEKFAGMVLIKFMS